MHKHGRPVHGRAERWRMFGRIALLAMIVGVVAARPGQAAEFDINLRVSDVETLMPITPRLELRVGSMVETMNFDLPSQRYHFEGDIETAQRKTYSILVGQLGHHRRRDVHVRLPVSDNVVEIPVEVFMSNLDQLTPNVVNRAALFLRNGQIDRALALLEAGMELSGGAANAVKASLEIHYGRALSAACQRLRYATCDKASRSLGESIKSAQTNPQILARIGITEGELKNAQNIALAVPLEEMYALARRKFEAGEYIKAAKEFEKFPTNESSLKLVRLSWNRVHYDLGVAYLKADIDKEKQTGVKSPQYLKKALAYFQSITNPGFERLTENLFVTRHRLARFSN